MVIAPIEKVLEQPELYPDEVVAEAKGRAAEIEQAQNEVKEEK